MLKIAVLFGHN